MQQMGCGPTDIATLAGFLDLPTRSDVVIYHMKQVENVRHSRIISGRDAAGRPVPAEEPVLEVDLGLADEVVRAEQVPVEHADREDGVLREGGLELEELAEDGVELLGDVVLLVGDALGAELEDEVGVGLAVDVHRVEVVGLDDVDPHEDVQGVVGGEALSNQRSIALVSVRSICA